MIYTWEINYENKALNLVDFIRLVNKIDDMWSISNITLENRYGDALSSPDLTENIICFNGSRTFFEHHESFKIQRVWNKDGLPLDINKQHELESFDCITGYGQCDTGNKPYDIVVAATLLMFKHHFPEKVKLYPEEINDNWKRGYDLAQQVAPLEALETLL